MRITTPANHCDLFDSALEAALSASADVPDDEDREKIEALIEVGKQYLGRLDDRSNAWTALNAVRGILKQYGLIDADLALKIESALAT